METKRKILNRYRKGEKIRAISRELNISRNTVKEIIRSHPSTNNITKNKTISSSSSITTAKIPSPAVVKDQESLSLSTTITNIANITNKSPSSSYSRSIQKYPALGDHITALEKLLRENKNAQPKKTTIQLFQQLQLQGYKGSYSPVSRYAKKWKIISSNVNPAACVPLSFAPGEAYQFDWSSDEIIINDKVVAVKVAHFILCYSRKKFVYIYPNETHEMVFDAHIRAFEFFGGTPVRGIYDNMKTAVQKVFQGKDRKWNPNFERLCAHYMIEPTACTPARGNEKGQVERQVAIGRQQFMTPMPKGKNLQEINDILTSQLIHYNHTHKHPKQQNKTIDEIFAEESHCLIPVTIAFDGCKETNIKVSITCLAQYDRNSYSVNCSCVGQIIQCKSYADKLIFVYNGQEVGRHERRFTAGQTYYNYQHYLPILARKPGALRNGAPFKDMVLPDEINKVREILEQHPNGARDFAHILSHIPMEGMDAVISACVIAITAKTVSKDVILNILFRKNDECDIIKDKDKSNHYHNDDTDNKNTEYLKIKHLPEENCNAYNQLLSNISTIGASSLKAVSSLKELLLGGLSS